MFMNEPKAVKDGESVELPPSGSGVGQQVSLTERLLRTDDLIAELDRTPGHELRALLPPSMATALESLMAQSEVGESRLLLDSDGTGYFRIESGNQDKDQQYYQELSADGRVLPDGAVRGETSMEFMYDLRSTPAQVEVWKRLSEVGVSVGILSGRKETDLRTIYAEAVDSVPDFELLPSKGRAVVSHGETAILPALRDRLSGDPLRKVAHKMAATITEMMPADRLDGLKDIDPLEPAGAKAFEKITGYRVSIQEVDDTVVLLRLHHRYRACELACARAGAQQSVVGVDDPARVHGDELSSWLESDAEGREVLAQLQAEDQRIMAAWDTELDSDTLGRIQLVVKDHVGYRSLSQDMAPDVGYGDVISSGRFTAGYAGDHFEEGGNDHPVMEALLEINPQAAILAISDDGTRAPTGLSAGSQFDLFLVQYLLARDLNERAISGVSQSALETSHIEPASIALGSLRDIDPAVISAVRDLTPETYSPGGDSHGGGFSTSEFFNESFVVLGSEHISPHAFLSEYCELHNAVTDRARAHLVSGATLDDMIEIRDRAEREMPVEPDAALFTSRDERLVYVNQVIRERIVRAARGETSEVVDEMGLDLAIMQLSHATSITSAIQALERDQSSVQQHTEILSSARNSSQSVQHPLARNQFEQMFLAALEGKLEQNGFIPPLVLLNDIDRNVAPTEHYNTLKPSAEIDVLLDTVVHALDPRIPIGPRVPIMHILAEDRAYGGIATEFYREVGRAVADEMFADVVTTAQLARANGIEFHLLSANLELCAEGVRDLLTDSPDQMRAIGASYDRILGIEKPVALAGEYIRDPHSLIVLTDDSNGATRAAMERGTILPQLSYPLPVEDLIIFASRVPGEGESPTPHKLQALLEDRGIPHGVNYRELKGGSFEGYQGTLRLTELYIEWRDRMLAGGAVT